ncbi:MAG: hypothetical protein R3D26_20240 [Cyanobacteriota/Melainabacteria group bacterium]
MSLKQQSTSGEDIPELKSSGDVDADIKAKEELTPTEKQIAARKIQGKECHQSTLSDLVLKPSAEEESTSTAGKTMTAWSARYFSASMASPEWSKKLTAPSPTKRAI